MAEANNDFNQPILNLTAEEKRAFATLFAQADKEQLGVVTGENAVSFFERTRVSPSILGEIWQIADTENRGLLTKPGFCIVLRLIGHYQAGREPTPELAFKPAPIPKFDGGPALVGPAPALAPVLPSSPVQGALQPQLSGTSPIRVPPLDPQKVQQFSALFERSGPQDGILDRFTAKAIFERAGLPNETLGRIWNLADRGQRGALDQTEFIVAMHLLTSVKSRAMTALPTVLPPGLYEAAARRGVPPPARQGPATGAIPRQLTGQLTGGSVGAAPRTQSPLARPPTYGAPAPVGPGQAWLVSPADKAKFDQYFAMVDAEGRGTISGEQAVSFFSDSRLPEDTLAQIWDLADINSAGQLTRDEFAVAMYLIRQQKAPNAGPLPAFLPPALVPPSMRRQQLQQPPQQAQHSTAPAFDNANHSSNLSKSAAEDLFGLDQPASPVQAPVLQPNNTGPTALKDPFVSSGTGSPARVQPPSQGPASMFKPFMPTSAFGASLTQQPTGGSVSSNPASAPRGFAQPGQAPASAADDLLGDNDTHAQESSKLANESMELANMSNQIGNLRNQMEQTQTKKATVQSDLAATSNQKRDLESRLQQFRAQYEQEVRAVKDLEQQLTASRENTKRLGQELAMLEGSYQDLQTQHQAVSQALSADQQENADLKARISQLNAEVARLKPEIEKMKLDARQQKGLVSINKKQLATTESERDRLQSEREGLERAAHEREAPAAAEAPVVSPAPSLSANNPFARRAAGDPSANRSLSPAGSDVARAAPTPSAFDELFGPSAAFAPSGQTAAGSSTPPPTSFVGRTLPAMAEASSADVGNSAQSFSSAGEPTPSATPPLSDKLKESTFGADPSAPPPPPPENRQFTASQLPIVNLAQQSHDSEARSTSVMPPASRAGDLQMPKDLASPGAASTHQSLTGGTEGIPGAFPTEEDATASAKDDFDAAFAGFDQHENAAGGAAGVPPAALESHAGSARRGPADSEFPPIESLELDDDDDDSDAESHAAFEDDLSSVAQKHELGEAAHASHPSQLGQSVQPAHSPPAADAQASPPTYEHARAVQQATGETDSSSFPPEFDGLLPSREDPTSPAQTEREAGAIISEGASAGQQESPATAQTSADKVLSLPSRANTADVFHDASSRPISNATDLATTEAHSAKPSANTFDEFDDFDDLAEAKEADGSGGDDADFGFDKHETAEFNPAFDSPAASMTNTMASSQQTPVVTSKSFGQADGGSAPHFSSSAFGSFAPSTANGSGAQAGQSGEHDWDAIFSGFDNSKNAADFSLTSDPWSSTSAGAAQPSNATAATAQPSLGRAITPGTEHDDPILKRLTGMGYPRKDALSALEKYDYDINRAVDHLSGN